VGSKSILRDRVLDCFVPAHFRRKTTAKRGLSAKWGLVSMLRT
jgi:hypothetical protein